MTVNALFALHILNMFTVMGKIHQQTTNYDLTLIEESGALNTNLLDNYVSATASEFGYSPIASLRDSADITVEIFDHLIIPTLCLLLANVILVGFCWKRRVDQEE